MLNRRLNKVTYGSEELLNLENDTVNEENLLRGETAHNRLGEGIIGEMDEGGGTSNYNHLSNKPQVNGVTLEGNKSSAQLGLASASALANYYTKSSVDTLLAGKSTVTPTLQSGTKIGEVQTGGATVNLYAPAGGGTTVDDTLSLESVNPVQNKVITAALNDKADGDDLDALEAEINAIEAYYSNVTATLSAGTKIGEIHTNNTTTDLFAPESIEGHVVITSTGVTMPQRAKIKINNAHVQDDPSGNATVITPNAESGSAHVVMSSTGQVMPQRSKIMFLNSKVTDDSVNDVTIVGPEGGGNMVKFYVDFTAGDLMYTDDATFTFLINTGTGNLEWEVN